MTSAEFIGRIFAETVGGDLELYANEAPQGFGHLGNRPRLAMVAEYCIQHWPGDIVEIGLGHGKTTRIFAEVARGRGRRVIAVDPFDVMSTAWGDDYFEVFLENTEPWRDIIDLFTVSSLNPEVIRTIGEWELCFAYVDGLHTYEACLSDIQTVGHCEGIIAVDDLHGKTGYSKALLRAFRDGAIALHMLPMDNSLSREGYLIRKDE